MKLGMQDFDNDKGAIIIGLNGSGKSSILNKLKEDGKKGIIKCIKNNNDKNDMDFIYIDSETHIKEITEGKNSLYNKSISNFIEKINKEEKQPENLFNKEELKRYEDHLIEISKKSFNKENIFDTNLSINYIPKIKKDDLLKAEIIITFNNVSYELEKASSGMKSIIHLALNNINGEETIDKVIAIDEIENFLHPEWIELAAFLINILFEKNIIIITTHNPLLLSLLLKVNPEILSRVERDDKKDYGNVITWNYQHLIEDIKEIIEKKMEIFEEKENKKRIDNAYIDKFIKHTLSDEISMIFFWEMPRIVEGQTEKTYLEQKYHKFFISAGGFHQFIVLHKIIKNFNNNINPMFLMDHDIKKYSMAYNNYIFNQLNEYKEDTVYRITEGDFDKLLHGKKSIIMPYDKISKAIDALIDDSNLDKDEMEKIKTFFKL